MSLALAAELNGYPGPAHVLELADQLKLNEQQKKKIQEMFKAMTKETKTLGVTVIEAERRLDTLFKSKTVNE
jgi:myo-inositol catabolism protein IolC